MLHLSRISSKIAIQVVLCFSNHNSLKPSRVTNSLVVLEQSNINAAIRLEVYMQKTKTSFITIRWQQSSKQSLSSRHSYNGISYPSLNTYKFSGSIIVTGKIYQCTFEVDNIYRAAYLSRHTVATFFLFPQILIVPYYR